jgi:hypothetical protein
MSFSDDFASRFIRLLRSIKVGEIIILFMSDNLFVAENVDGKVGWGSFDVSKMEGAHDSKDIESYVEFTLDHFNF